MKSEPTQAPAGAPNIFHNVRIKRLHEEAKLPTKATPLAAGFDLYAFIRTEERKANSAFIPPRSTRLISTGLVCVAPPGYALFVCSRSGLATKSIFVTNSPGIVDPDYRGELKVMLYNGGVENYWVRDGDRIAQFLVAPIFSGDLLEVKLLDETERGEAGFGSTGR